jgi:hypothetical protein
MKSNAAPARNAVPGPPTGLAKRFVRYVLGFGVSVAVGLAPFLGKINVPLFDSLLSIIPESIQNTVLPLSAFLMGVVAVTIQWYAEEKISRNKIRNWYKRTLVFMLLTLLLFITVHSFVVVSVPIKGGKDSVSFLVGFSRPYEQPCMEDVSDKECIKLLTFDAAKIESFWGDRNVQAAKICLIFTYVSLTATFGALVGLLIIRDHLAKNR